MKRKTYYTTTEYVKRIAFTDQSACIRDDFSFFDSIVAAQYDAQWYFDYWRRQGKRKARPRVVKVTFEILETKTKEK